MAKRLHHDAGRADPLTLRTVLTTIEANPPFLSPRSNLDVDQLKADLRLVQRNTDPAGEHQTIWRDQLFAHRDPTKIVDGRRFVDR